jgi:vacuolar-type H+-ATPase subunit I/STV1
MAGTTSTSGGGATVPRQSMEESEVTGWVGWIVFAGTMMMILGVFHMFEGLIALFRHTQIAFPASGLTVQVSYNQWGWLQLIAGALVFAAGVGLFTGRMWARSLGVILVSISALINFAWANLYPFWSLTLLALDFFIIYAIIAHGSEMKVAREVE